MAWFRDTPAAEPLVVAMTAIRRGDRLLIIGGRDAQTVAHLALKPGISGRACVVDDDQAIAARAGETATREGALIETETAPFTMLPYDDGAFDIVVLNHTLSSLPEGRRAGALNEARRVLRDGGRCVAVDAGRRGGLASLLGGKPSLSSSDIERTLTAANFRAVQTLADREGLVFIEGAKRD